MMNPHTFCDNVDALHIDATEVFVLAMGKINTQELNQVQNQPMYQ